MMLRTIAALMLLVLLPGSAFADESEFTICTQPLGKFDAKLLSAAEKGARYIYGVTVRRLETRPLPKTAYYAPRKRWRADKLLAYLRTLTDETRGCTIVVGFTARDISTTKSPHKDWGILGLGEVGGRVAMVSTFRVHKRLKPPHTAARRTVKVFNHEVGHVMGLPHVPQAGCLMEDAHGTVLTVDGEHGLLCPSTIEFIEARRGLKIPRYEAFDWSVIREGSSAPE